MHLRRLHRVLAALALVASLLTGPAAAGATSAARQITPALPAALIAGDPARPMTIDLPATPSPDATRAAFLAASAAQRAAGANGIRVRAVAGVPVARLNASPGSVVTIAPARRPGLSVAPLGGGRVRLTISGTGEGLLTAARLLSSPAVHAFDGRPMTVPAGLVPARTVSPAPATIPVTPGSVTGHGKLVLTSSFQLPVERQLTGTDPLRLITGYVSRGGGRVSVHLAAGLLGSTDVPASGQVRTTLGYALSDSPTLTGDAVPGWWAHAGTNPVTLTAIPSRAGAAGTLELMRGSRLAVQTTPRPVQRQLELWPFPLYDRHAWSHTTVALSTGESPAVLSALITALANTERVTGLPADPQVAYGSLSAAQTAGNVLFAGFAATAAATGGLPGAGPVRATEPHAAGVLEEVRLAHGGTGLLAYGARGLSALGPVYQAETLNGRAVLVDAHAHGHTLVAAADPTVFTAPRWPWLAPAAFLAALALGWVALRLMRTRRRLATLPAFEVELTGSGS